MKPKEMTIAFMTPRRNQLMIDRMVAAVQEFAVKHAGLDKLVIEVHDSSELKKKDETIQKLISALGQIAKQGYGYQGYYEENDYEGLAEHATKEHLRLCEIARQVLKEVRPEPLIIIDEEVPDIDLNDCLNIIRGDDDGKV